VGAGKAAPSSKRQCGENRQANAGHITRPALDGLPLTVYEEHFLPFFTLKEASCLGQASKFLQITVSEKLRDVGSIPLMFLEKAMTFCPKSRSIVVTAMEDDIQDSTKDELTDILKKKGKSLERIIFTTDRRGTTNKGKILSLAVASAKRQEGCLTNLKALSLPMLITDEEREPGSLQNVLKDLKDLSLTERAGAQVVFHILAGVGLAPQLERLTLQGICQRSNRGLPNFIPSTLKELYFDAPTLTQGNELVHVTEAVVQSLQKSGAQLEVLLMPKPRGDTGVGANGRVAGEEWLLQLAKLIAPSVCNLRLILPNGKTSLVTELTSCEKLVKLESSANLFEGHKITQPFTNLKTLVMRACLVEKRGLWRAMKDKAFPTLESLTLHINLDIFSSSGENAAEYIRKYLGPALKALRHTLKELVIKGENSTFPPPMVVHPDVFVAVGEAMARLYQLRTLSLRGLYSKGFQAYEAIASGLQPTSLPYLSHLLLQARGRSYGNITSMRSLYNRQRYPLLRLTLIDSINWAQGGFEDVVDLAFEILAEGAIDRISRVELADDPEDKGRGSDTQKELWRRRRIATLRELLGVKFALVL